MASGTILIIDDDEILSSLYKTKFERVGYKVAICKNGKEAFDAMLNGLKPSIIVLDINMPVMDGLTFLKEASFKLHLPPIIVMTSEEADSTRLDSLVHGAHAYVIKATVTPSDLLIQIESLLKDNPSA